MPAWSTFLQTIGSLIAGRGGRHPGRRRRPWPIRRHDGQLPPRRDDGWSNVVNELKHSIGPDSRPRHVVRQRGKEVGRHGKSAR